MNVSALTSPCLSILILLLADNSLNSWKNVEICPNICVFLTSLSEGRVYVIMPFQLCIHFY
jgi:hypothetical protein